MKKEKEFEFNPDSNYSENFWPKILTPLSIGAFIYWVMTSDNADKILDHYLCEPILRQFDRIKYISLFKGLTNFFSCERIKGIFLIGVIAISPGFSAKNLISYSTECMREEVVLDLFLIKGTKKLYQFLAFSPSKSPKSHYIYRNKF